MKIVLHVGPHKTGTTSIQSYLAKQFGSEVSTSPVWYPLPRQRRPGHSVLAQSMCKYAPDRGENPLGELISEAEANGVQLLILSAEGFSIAYPKHLDGLREALVGRDVTLVTTQNSLIRRASSLWQESLKHRRTSTLDDAVAWIMSTPGYQPNFVKCFAEAIRPQCIALVYSSPADPPHVLIDRIMDVMDLKVDPHEIKAVSKANQRLGRIEAELLRHMNSVISTYASDLDHHSHLQLRQCLSQMFRDERWRAHCPAVEIRLPETARQVIARRAAEVSEAFAALADEWPVVVRGDPAVLTFDHDSQTNIGERSAAL